MKEIVSLFLGQAGNQMGFSIWELFCAEHGISRDGKLTEDLNFDDRSFQTFFQESHTGRFVPRGLFIDMEPTVISQLRTGSYASLYHPMQLISGMDDSSSNFSRAYYTVGRTLYPQIENQLRKQIEACDRIQTVMLHRSLAGGTGSGLTSMTFEILSEYSKTTRLEFPIHPAPHFDSCVVGPYNSILAEHFCMDECDVGLLFDNEALFDICTNVLDIKYPTMSSINRILAQVCSSLTAATRFHNDLCNDVTVVLTNLVPYPRIHFPLVSFAPLANSNQVNCESSSITNMTRDVFDISTQLVKCDPASGKYMSCSLVYRGFVSPCEVYATLSVIKNSRKIKFVDWCPTGFKIGIVDQPPLILPQSRMGETKTNVVMMTNSSSVSTIWQRLSQKFHNLYSKRSFIHWFVAEGLEESEFCEALYNLATLAKDYEEVSVDSMILETGLNKTDKKEKSNEGEDEGKGESVEDDEDEETTDTNTNDNNKKYLSFKSHNNYVKRRGRRKASMTVCKENSLSKEDIKLRKGLETDLYIENSLILETSSIELTNETAYTLSEAINDCKSTAASWSHHRSDRNFTNKNANNKVPNRNGGEEDLILKSLVFLTSNIDF